MKRLIYVLFIFLIYSCSEKEETIQEDTCPDKTCGKVINYEKRRQPSTSAFDELWYWNVEMVCSKKTFWHKSYSSSVPQRGTIICLDEWIDEN